MPRIAEADLILNEDGSVYHLNLLPQHLSDTIITVGDPSRVYQVSKYFSEITFEMNRREFITHVGLFNNKRVTVISTGIGTDNVEIVLTELDALANIDLITRQPKTRTKKLRIIRVGTSGALQQDIPVGAHLVSDYAVGFDNLHQFYPDTMNTMEREIAEDILKEVGLPFKPCVIRGSESLKLQIGFDMVNGNTLTCPGFYAPQGRQMRIQGRFRNLLATLTNYHERRHDFWLTNFEMETSGYYLMGRLLGHEILSVNAIIANRAKNTVSQHPNDVIESLIVKVLERI